MTWCKDTDLFEKLKLRIILYPVVPESAQSFSVYSGDLDFITSTKKHTSSSLDESVDHRILSWIHVNLHPRPTQLQGWDLFLITTRCLSNCCGVYFLRTVNIYLSDVIFMSISSPSFPAFLVSLGSRHRCRARSRDEYVSPVCSDSLKWLHLSDASLQRGNT